LAGRTDDSARAAPPGAEPPVSAPEIWPPPGLFTADQWATLTAAVDRVVPADDYPSGSQAGVLDYLARQFDGDLAGQLGLYRLGLDALSAEGHVSHRRPFTQLTATVQDRLLQAIEAGDACSSWPVDPRLFFAALVGHVMEGFYGDPGNGGNRNAVSWHMIGFVVRG
jgi:hypothetical protein